MLLSLPRVDSVADAATFGVHHRTAIIRSLLVIPSILVV